MNLALFVRSSVPSQRKFFLIFCMKFASHKLRKLKKSNFEEKLPLDQEGPNMAQILGFFKVSYL